MIKVYARIYDKKNWLFEWSDKITQKLKGQWQNMFINSFSYFDYNDMWLIIAKALRS